MASFIFLQVVGVTLFGSRSFVWFAFVRLVRVRSFGSRSRSFVWFTFVRLVRVRSFGSRSFVWFAFVRLVRVRSFGSCSFVWFAFVRGLTPLPIKNIYYYIKKMNTY